MKQQSKLLLSLLNGAGIGVVLMSGGSLLSTDAEAQIASTKHNLGGATGNRVSGGATGEICVFCHTPHGADTSAPVPLWNKLIPPSTGYTTYAQLGTSSLDAAANNGSVATGSISLACLSCHDGSQAMDNIVNAPGSGGLDATGGGTAGRSGATWAWTSGTGTTVSADGALNAGATFVANLTKDLRNDHPIGVAYCGGSLAAGYVAATTTNCRDGDFKAIQLASLPATLNTATAQYYVETTANGSRDKSDMMLYTRNMGGVERASVECGSCHDPHVAAKATNQTAFLRVSQEGSGVCLACHSK